VHACLSVGLDVDVGINVGVDVDVGMAAVVNVGVGVGMGVCKCWVERCVILRTCLCHISHKCFPILLQGQSRRWEVGKEDSVSGLSYNILLGAA
jgi:hypothetical protein